MSTAELTLRLAAMACSLLMVSAAVALTFYMTRHKPDRDNWVFIAAVLLLLAGCAGAASMTGTAALPW